jgi:hypothetical protein
MGDQPRAQVAPVEPYFDRTPEPFGAGLPDPLVYDASARALRQRTVNFAAKRRADMRYVSGLDRGATERHFRWRPAVAPGGLGFRASPDGQAALVAAHRAGDLIDLAEIGTTFRRAGGGTVGHAQPVSYVPAQNAGVPGKTGSYLAAGPWTRERAWAARRRGEDRDEARRGIAGDQMPTTDRLHPTNPI